jgi:hypothetical protein
MAVLVKITIEKKYCIGMDVSTALRIYSETAYAIRHSSASSVTSVSSVKTQCYVVDLEVEPVTSVKTQCYFVDLEVEAVTSNVTQSARAQVLPHFRCPLLCQIKGLI